MSVLKVNAISNLDDDGPVEFSSGLNFPGDLATGDGDVFINFTGVCTCGSLVGDASNMSFPGFLAKTDPFKIRSIM